MDKKLKKTVCVHSNPVLDPETWGVNTPIFTSTSYGYLDTENRIYPRYYNTPNQKVLIEKVCALENAEAGIIFSSGMAAISTTIYSLLKKGDHAVFQSGLYGGTTHFIYKELRDFGLNYTITNGNKIEDFKKNTQRWNQADRWF